MAPSEWTNSDLSWVCQFKFNISRPHAIQGDFYRYLRGYNNGGGGVKSEGVESGGSVV